MDKIYNQIFNLNDDNDYDFDLNYVQNVIRTLGNEGDSDPETYQIIERKIIDSIMNEIIKGKLDKKDILRYCELIKQMINLPISRWYG